MTAIVVAKVKVNVVVMIAVVIKRTHSVVEAAMIIRVKSNDNRR